ncbi:hypothetical protein PhaeoP18_03954 (plasmid) [Phaeobacter piscinae]|nr:hypothetical protein PhaeoP14_03715 [Phaeobacter piscinae]AUR38170.1 hypothetical protein PhaeoP18_03954 [Phaeobacter piscinae]
MIGAVGNVDFVAAFSARSRNGGFVAVQACVYDILHLASTQSFDTTPANLAQPSYGECLWRDHRPSQLVTPIIRSSDTLHH